MWIRDLNAIAPALLWFGAATAAGEEPRAQASATQAPGRDAAPQPAAG